MSSTENNRQRDCLILIADHLQSEGYHDIVSLLKQQVPALDRFECADNINLRQILSDFLCSHEVKYGMKPLISRKSCGNENSGDGGSRGSTKGSKIRKKQAAAARRRASMEYRPGSSTAEQHTSTVLKHLQNQLEITGESSTSLSSRACSSYDIESESNSATSTDQLQGITGRAIAHSQSDQGSSEDSIEDRVLKPLPNFGGDIELQALARSIQSEIIQSDTGVQFQDIVGLDEPKRLLREAVITPLQYPRLFTGLLSPWRGTLMYGSPGTGKTMLAKAVAATATGTTFFNISASSIVSKFRGDSEKLVRVLFDLARYHSPSVIFLDEIDSIMGARSGSSSGDGGCSEHEGSRRMKTELLIQMDGLLVSNDHVFVLAASNLPWQLDPALLRRLDKRVLVPLPNKEARKRMLQGHITSLPAHICHNKDFEACAEATEGYSGADLRLMAKEAAMKPVRRILNELGGSSISDEQLERKIQQYPVTPEDLKCSLQTTNKSYGSELCDRYEQFAKEFGSV